MHSEFKISDHVYNAIKEIDADRRSCSDDSDQYPAAHLARILSTVIRRDNQWRVIGISENALKCLADNNFEKPKKTIQRGHLVPRADVASFIFANRDEFISKDELETVLWFYDQTVLMTVDENKDAHNTPDFYRFEFEDISKVLFASAYIGHKYGKSEKNFIKMFHDQPDKRLVNIKDIYPDGLDTHLNHVDDFRN